MILVLPAVASDLLYPVRNTMNCQIKLKNNEQFM